MILPPSVICAFCDEQNTDVTHSVDFYSLFRAKRGTRIVKGFLWSDVDFDSEAIKINVVPKSPFWRRGSKATNVLLNLHNIRKYIKIKQRFCRIELLTEKIE